MASGLGRVFLSFLLVCVLSGSLVGQDSNQILVDADYQNQSLSEVLNDLARKSQIDFYYQPEKLPSENLTISFQQRTLAEALERVLRPTDLGFMFYRDYAVVVADKLTLSQFYTADYYSALEESRIRLEALEGSDMVKLVAGDPNKINLSGAVRVTGLITEKENGEPIIGATFFIKELQKGVATDVSGRFVVDMPVGGYEVIARYVGYEDLNATLSAYDNGQIEVQLEKDAITLDEVVVEALAADENVRSVNIGIERLTPKSIEKLPSFLGEVDIIKSLTLLPGVSTIG
ncbi:MAG: carboxypeptidase-like regulatory domain-containing protein, partial [Cyclobacteriaceae bacterium]